MNNNQHVQNTNTQYQPEYSILEAVKAIKELSPNNSFIKIMDKTVDIYIKTVSSINDLIKLHNISRSDIAVATGCSLKEIDKIFSLHILIIYSVCLNVNICQPLIVFCIICYIFNINYQLFAQTILLYLNITIPLCQLFLPAFYIYLY